MQIFTLLTYLALIVVGVTFAGLNADPVIVKYYIGTQQMPLSVLLIGLLVVGIFIGMFSSLMKTIKLRLENKRLKSKLGLAEKEISQLRLISVKEKG